MTQELQRPEERAVSIREGRAIDDDAAIVFPFYLVLDVSYSMLDVMPQVNQALSEFRGVIIRDPVLADITKVGIIEFSDTASEVLPLGDLGEQPIPTLRAKASTSYASAFQLLRVVIERDVAAARRARQTARPDDETFHFYRPCVYFLSDGAPNPGDGWEQAFADLLAIKAYPMVVPFGMGEADPTVLSKLVHPRERSRLYLAKHGANPDQIIREMLKAMVSSVVQTSLSGPAGKPQVKLPTQDEVGDSVDVYDADLLF